MDLLNLIRRVEEKWLARLYIHCRHLFDAVFLPSHDHLHHHRVWEFAKGIMHGLNNSGHDISPGLVEQLIIAAFFHDTGLTVTLDEKHGAASRMFCRDYLREPGVPDTGGLANDELLKAIEHHDDKSFSAGTGEGDGMMSGLQDILTGSDDLDALGATGIYRYAEIYLLRGVNARELPGRVLENLDARFRKLLFMFGGIPGFTGRQTPRYHLVRDFYERLNKDVPSGRVNPPWESVLIDLIAINIERRVNLMDPDVPVPDAGPEIKSFLKVLHSEIPAFSPPAV